MPRHYDHFYIVQPGDSASTVLAKLYGFSPMEVARFLPAIANNNPHIHNLNQLRPGQWLDVALKSSPAGMQLHRASDMNELERIHATLSPPQKEFLTDYPHVVSTILDLISDAAINTADAAAYTIGRLVRNCHNVATKYGEELTRNYASHAHGTLEWEIRNMILNRQPVKDALNQIPRFVQNLLLEEARNVATPTRFNQARVIGEIRKLIRLSPTGGLSRYNPFSQTLAKYANVVRYSEHAGTLLSIVIPTTIAAVDSYRTYGTSEFGSTTAKGVGNVAGGFAGSAAGYAICNMVFGTPSAGTSLFWCGIAVGAAAGMRLSSLGNLISKTFYKPFVASGARFPHYPIQSIQCEVPKW